MISTKNAKGKHYLYQFTLFCSQGQINLKFPCTFFLKWSVGRPGDISKVAVNTQNEQSNITDGKIAFKKTLTMNVPMVYDTQKKVYGQKMSNLAIYLTSTSRPKDEPKMAGFFKMDLSVVLNGLNPYGKHDSYLETLRIHPLERCPDKNSTISFTLTAKRIQQIAMDEVNSDYEDRDITTRFLSQNSVQQQSSRAHRQLINLREEKAFLEKQLQSNRVDKDLLKKMSSQLESSMEENARLHKKHEEQRKQWQQINNRLQLELKAQLFRHESIKSPRDNDEQLRKALIQETKKVARLEAQRTDNLKSWQIITRKLQSDIKTLQNQLQQEQLNITSLKQKIQHLTYDLRDRQSQLAIMRQQYGRIAHLYQLKITQAQSHQEKLLLFSQDLKFVQESSIKLIDQISQKQAKEQQYIEKIEMLQRKLHNLEDHNLKQENSRLKQQLEILSRNLITTTSKLDEKNKTIETMKQSHEETQEILRKEKEILQQNLEYQRQQYKKLQQKHDNVQSLVITLTKQKAKLTKNDQQNYINMLSQNYQEVSKLKKMLAQKEKVIMSLNKSMKAVIQQGPHEEKSIETIYHSHIQNSQTELEQLKKQLSNLNELLFEHEASINQWEMKYSRLEEKYRNMEKQNRKRDQIIEEQKKNIHEQSMLLIKSRESEVLMENQLNLLKEEYEDMKRTQTMKSRHNSQSSLCREGLTEDKTLATKISFLAKMLEGYTKRMPDDMMSNKLLENHQKIQDVISLSMTQKMPLEVSIANLSQNINKLKVNLLKKANTIDQQRITVSIVRPLEHALGNTREIVRSLFSSMYRNTKFPQAQPNSLTRSKTSPRLV